MKRILILFLVISTTGFAQKFVAEAPLPVVEKQGFYSIPLTPAITSLLESDYRNVRIIDEAGAEVPYIFQVEKRHTWNEEFVEYKMEKELKKGCCTILIFNNERKPIDNVLVRIRNASIVKEATMEASDDKETWYALKDKFQIAPGNVSSTRYMNLLDFPLSDYAYYRVTINDSTTAPLNIIDAGYNTHSVNNGMYTELPNVSVTSADSTGQLATWGIIKFDSVQFIDRLEFEISGPPFYRRAAVLLQENLNPIHTFYISSAELPSIELSVKTPQLLLQISNENNPPLKIKSVKAWQLKRSLTTWLATGHTYKIAVGSDSLQMPVYDLQFFRDSIPGTPMTLKPGDVNILVRPAVASTTPTYFTNRNIIWVAIIVVIGVLGTMSVRMMREKGDQQTNR